MGRRPKDAINSDNDPKNRLTFVGANIRKLRKERGLTLGELAEKAGIQEGPMGRIERGLNAPSARVLYNLNKTFDVSIDTLFAESDALFQRRKDAESNAPYLVDLSGTIALGKKTLSKIETYFEVERKLDTLLGRHSSVTLPLRLSDSLMEVGAARFAREVRALMGLRENVLGLDWFQAMEALGFRIARFPFREDLDGLLYFDQKRQDVFFILNAARPQERQLFEMARSLGALYVWLDILDNDENLPKENLPRLQSALDAFAMELLLPEEAAVMTTQRLGVGKDDWTYALLTRLKQRSGIPADRFLKRMEELALIGRKPAMAIREKLSDFYAKASMGEPCSCRYARQPNGAIWERLESLAASEEDQEAQAIAESLDKISLARR